MNRIIQWPTYKILVATSIVACLAIIAGVVFFTENAQAVTLCSGAPDRATMNPFPVTYTDEPCKDYPALDARIQGSEYSQSKADWNNGLSVKDGDIVEVLIYIHNGAEQTSDITKNKATQVRVTANVPLNSGSSHNLSVSFGGSNTNTINEEFTVKTPAGSKLVPISNSGELFDFDGKLVRSDFDPINKKYAIGTMLPCFEYSYFLKFKMKVEGPSQSNPTLAPTKAPSATSTPQDRPDRPSCPFIPQANRTIINFPNVELVRNNCCGLTNQGMPISVNLPAGSYSILLASFDDSHPQAEAQAYEQYYLQMEDSNGIVFKSSPISDLPDILNATNQTVNTNASFPRNVTTVKAVHALPVVQSSVAQSITPICAAVDLMIVATPTATPSPTPTMPPVTIIDPSLNINKLARNVTQNGSTGDIIGASEGNTVEFLITVGNASGTDRKNAENVVVKDFLPNQMDYISNSTFVNGSIVGDGIVSNGVNLGTLVPGETDSVVFKARIRDDAVNGTGTIRVTNTAQAQSSNASTVNDSAFIDINGDNLSCSPSSQTVAINQQFTLSATGGNGVYYWYAEGAVPGFGYNQNFTARYSSSGTKNISVQSGGNTATCTIFVTSQGEYRASIEKNVRNVSQNSIESSSVFAKPNETIEFIIKVRNTGNRSINNTYLRDELPNGLAYIPNSTTINGNSRSDGIVTGDILLGAIGAGETVTIKFRAETRSSSYYGSGTTTLINTARTWGDNISSISDIATVYVDRDVVIVDPSQRLEISKYGFNVSSGQTSYRSSVNGEPGDTLEFVLVIRSRANSNLFNVVARDALPSGLSYISGTTTRDGSVISNGIVDGGVNLGTLSPGQQWTIRFRAQVRDASYFVNNTSYLSNLGFTRADGISEIRATLPITIKKDGAFSTVGRIKTGLDSKTLALLLGLLSVVLYLLYAKTNLFKIREAGALASQNRNGDPFSLI